jgi:hypothetical protein
MIALVDTCDMGLRGFKLFYFAYKLIVVDSFLFDLIWPAPLLVYRVHKASHNYIWQ